MAIAAMPEEEAEKVPHPRSAGLALIVDDEKLTRVLLAAKLEPMGYTVAQAGNGEEAVRLYRKRRPDIVFMDVMMPRMDGIEATRHIKALAEDDFVPIVFLTAVENDDIVSRCIEAGGDDFLGKPFSEQMLAAKIRALGRIRDLQRRVRELYVGQRHDEEIAREVFSGAVTAGNLDLDAVRSISRSADVFSGDVILTARAPSGNVHLLVGDFTGHGLSAALGALPAAETFRAMTAKGFSGIQILDGVNKKLVELLPTGMFLAATFVSVDPRLEHVEIYNCGLPDALLVDGRTGHIRQRLESQSLALGVMGKLALDAGRARVPIHAGDRLVVASDGLSEAVNPHGESFGMGRLAKAIEETDRGSPLTKHVQARLDDFCAGETQSDDVTMVELDCVPALFRDPAPAPARLGARRAGGWEFSLSLKGAMLRDVDPVPLIMSQIQELEGPAGRSAELYTVLTELFVNALDHGVLGLDSSIKEGPDGFQAYFEERSRRLAALGDGVVRITLRTEPDASSPSVVIDVKDSGPGFDRKVCRARHEEASALHGRGIRLVRELCGSFRYKPPGNEAEAVYAWKT